MRKILSLIICIAICSSMIAKPHGRYCVDDFFNDYAGREGTESSMLGSSTLRALSERPGLGKKTERLLRSLNRIWAISSSSDNSQFLADAQLTTKSRNDYELTQYFDKGGETVSIYFSERPPKSLIMISVSPVKISYMEIRGEFSLLDVGDLTAINAF